LNFFEIVRLPNFLVALFHPRITTISLQTNFFIHWLLKDYGQENDALRGVRFVATKSNLGLVLPLISHSVGLRNWNDASALKKHV